MEFQDLFAISSNAAIYPLFFPYLKSNPIDGCLKPKIVTRIINESIAIVLLILLFLTFLTVIIKVKILMIPYAVK